MVLLKLSRPAMLNSSLSSMSCLAQQSSLAMPCEAGGKLRSESWRTEFGSLICFASSGDCSLIVVCTYLHFSHC